MPVTASEYMSKSGMAWEEPLPSGMAFLVKRPTPEAFMGIAGYVPLAFDPQTATRVAAQQALAKLKEENDASVLFDFRKALLTGCVIAPKIVDKPIDQCAADEIPLVMVDPKDSAHLMTVLLQSVNYGGTPEQKSFREEQATAPDARRDGEEVQQTAERAAETSA